MHHKGYLVLKVVMILDNPGTFWNLKGIDFYTVREVCEGYSGWTLWLLCWTDCIGGKKWENVVEHRKLHLPIPFIYIRLELWWLCLEYIIKSLTSGRSGWDLFECTNFASFKHQGKYIWCLMLVLLRNTRGELVDHCFSSLFLPVQMGHQNLHFLKCITSSNLIPV